MTVTLTKEYHAFGLLWKMYQPIFTALKEGTG
jgi:hypothetical protein